MVILVTKQCLESFQDFTRTELCVFAIFTITFEKTIGDDVLICIALAIDNYHKSYYTLLRFLLGAIPIEELVFVSGDAQVVVHLISISFYVSTH